MLSLLELFNNIREECVSIIRSGIMIQIMISLSFGEKTLSDLREITGSKSQTIIPILRRLETKGYIGTSRYFYFITPLGRLVYTKIQEYFVILASIEKNRQFWDTHCLDAIPMKLLAEIGDLVDAEVFKVTNIDFFSLYNDTIQMIREAKRLRIMTSVYGAEYQKEIIDNVFKGIPVEIIMTPEIGEMVKKSIEKDRLLQENLPESPVDLWITDDSLTFVLLVSDSSMYLYLCFKDGTNLDISTVLIGKDQKSIAWGERLFNYYIAGAQKVEL